MTPTVGARITANTDAAAVAISTADPGGTTPGREGFAAATLLPLSLAATRCRMGFQVSCTGVGAMLSPGIPRPLAEGMGKSHSNKNSASKGPKGNGERRTGRRAAQL